jgi:aminoglycoside/choline kinase family phosphotransferase
VSLLRDSYVDLPDECVSSLLEEFLRLTDTPEPESEFRRRFDTMALQRNLKALGTFGYQTATRGNPVYVQYIPRTLHYAQVNLARNPRFSRLHRLLAALVDELE